MVLNGINNNCGLHVPSDFDRAPTDQQLPPRVLHAIRVSGGNLPYCEPEQHSMRLVYPLAIHLPPPPPNSPKGSVSHISGGGEDPPKLTVKGCTRVPQKGARQVRAAVIDACRSSLPSVARGPDPKGSVDLHTPPEHQSPEIWRSPPGMGHHEGIIAKHPVVLDLQVSVSLGSPGELYFITVEASSCWRIVADRPLMRGGRRRMLAVRLFSEL